MYPVVHTPEFNKCLRELAKKGKKGKDAILKARAAQSEAATEGEINSLSRTKHGESRLPDIEKFEVGDGYRLVVQVVDSKRKQRAFLFVGDHEDAERWLENHKKYKWVKRNSDSTLEFVQVSDPRAPLAITPDVDLQSPEALLHLPLLRDIKQSVLLAAGFSKEVVDYLAVITPAEWEQDPNGIASHLTEIASEEMAVLAIDLLELAFHRNWDALSLRLEVETGSAVVVDGADAAAAMISSANSEHFVTWDDSADLPPETSWADWMLFLHPEQKEFVEKDFNGATRLRGVSGSGKTCVIVHRARRLAKKYRQPILLVTLTDSMRRLLDVLVKDLCGAESAYIKTSTMNAIATDTIAAIATDGLRSFTSASRIQYNQCVDDALRHLKTHTGFSKTAMSKMPNMFLDEFLREEIDFVRQRFLPEEYDNYLTAKRFGRELPLVESARTIILSGVAELDKALGKIYVRDDKAIVQLALRLLNSSIVAARNTFNYRCVLVDEVQDLSQLEIRILSLIPDQESGKRVVNLPDGLFLVGDGAQTIYKKGFAFSTCGVEIGPRSFVLQKNYRNTKEILEAAYGLIEKYEFADVDEENIAKPTAPHLSARHGERPLIIKCQSEADETDFVVNQIRQLMEEQRSKDEADEHEAVTAIPIGVIGFKLNDRARIETALRKAKIPCVELREDVGWENNAVKISTLESAKGHEFHAVFMVGVHQGAIPNARFPKEDWKREAARLYVGMTRARDKLFLTYNVSDRGGPSVFLASIQDACVECEYKRGELVNVD